MMALTASEWADNAGDAALGPAWAVEFVLHSWRPAGPRWQPADPGESIPIWHGGPSQLGGKVDHGHVRKS